MTTATTPEWDLTISPRRSLFDIGLNDIWRYRDLLLLFVHRDIVTTYKQTILGPVWFFVQPLLTTLVFLLVFGNIAKLSTDGVPAILFYLSGIIIWNYFAECFNKTSTTFASNTALFGKVYFPRILTPLSIIVSNLIRFAIQFVLFIVLLIAYLISTDTVHPNITLLLTPYLLVLMAGMALGFGIIFTSLTTKYRDLIFIVQFGVQLAMYATPIIYPMSSLSPGVRSFLWWNPLSHVVEAFKYGWLGAGELSILGIIYSSFFAGIVLLLGIVIFNQTEKTFMDTV